MHMENTLITNNAMLSLLIIILLISIVCAFFYIRKKHAGSMQKNNIENRSEDKANNNYERQQYINTLNITHNALLQLIEDPESTEPFILFLNEIDKLTKAISSAIFISTDSSTQLSLLASTEQSDSELFDVVSERILPKIASFETDKKITEIFEETIQPNYKFIWIQLNQDSQGVSLLILKMTHDTELSDATISTLLEYTSRLANIVTSVRKARLKLRQTQYEERAVIARELHDSLAQSLSYLKIQTSRLQKILTDNEIQTFSKYMEVDSMMQDLRSNLNIAYRHLRELISTFRLTMGGKNFSQALSDSVEEFSKRSGIAFDIDNRLPTDILTVTEETQLLHIIRESLSNVVRHSQAKISLISIHYNDIAQVTAIIEDDGIGLPDVSNPEQHFGIIIMQERAHSIGGNISLTERVNGGACLKIVFRASKHIEKTSNS